MQINRSAEQIFKNNCFDFYLDRNCEIENVFYF